MANGQPEEPPSRGGSATLGRDATARLAVFDAVIAHMPTAVLVETAGRRIFAVNSRFCQMFGFPVEHPEDLVGADCAAGAEQSKHLLAKPARFITRVEEIIAAGKTVRAEEVRFADGRITERDYVPVHDRAGAFTAHIWQYRDVTEERSTIAALQRSEANYRELFENAAFGIYRSSIDGKFLTVNPALVQMLGYDSPRELLALDMARDVYADLTERDRLIARGAEHFEAGEVTWKRKDGSPIQLLLSGRRLHDAAGRLVGFETFVVDVTRQRALEGQLRQAQKMETIGQLAGGIAHDFNNLLTVILGNAQLLEESIAETQPELLPEVQDLTAAARRAVTLTGRLLSVSRRSELRLVPTDLCALVDNIVPMIRRLIPGNIRIDVATGEPVCAARLDAGAIEQILLNLVNNARDAMPRGGELRLETREVELRATDLVTRPWMAPGRYVMLTVRDDGAGMDEGTLARVFEPFFTTKEAGRGSGLGMAMVHNLAVQHHGHVGVESTPGTGTAVHVYFPVTPEPAGPTPQPSQSRFPRGSETILLVEDEASLRRTGRRILERYGYQVIEAGSAEEALAAYLAGPGEIDLVVSDEMLPGLTGRELRQQLIDQLGGVRFVLTTGYAERRPEELEDPGSVVRKPWNVDELLARVREALDS